MEKEKQKSEDKDEEEDKNENNAQALVLFEEKKEEDKEVKDNIINDYNDEKYNDCNFWHVEISDSMKDDILNELD